VDVSALELADLVPHRPPILVLDEIVSVSDERAVTRGRVSESALVDEGALWIPALIEGIAQSACVLNGYHDRVQGLVTEKGMLVEVRKLDVLRAPRVGEAVDYHVDLIKRLLPLVLVNGAAFVGDECVARGELKFFVEVA